MTDGVPDVLLSDLDAAFGRVLAAARGQVLDAMHARVSTLVAAGGPGDEPPAHVPNPDTVFDLDEWKRQVETEVGPALERVLVDAANKAGIGVSFDLADPRMANAVARHVSGITAWGDEMRSTVARTIERGMAEGWSIDRMAEALADTGIMSETRGRLIARTEAIAAANAGTIEGWKLLGFITDKKWSSTPDERTRLTHIEADGQTVGVDDRFTIGGFEADYPGDPALPLKERVNCFPADTLVDHADVVSGFRRWYDGRMVVVTTASGRVAGTPNHPMLTSHGWVALEDLKPGDHLVRCGLVEHRSSRVDPDEDDRPAGIGQVFQTLLDAGQAERVPAVAVNLHGDRPDGDVDVVRADRPLSLRMQAPLDQPADDLPFTLAYMGLGRPPGPGSGGPRLGTLDLAAAGRVGRGDPVGPGLRGHLRHGHSVGLAATAALDPEGIEPGRHRGPGDPEVPGDSEHGLAAAVSLDEVVDVQDEAFHGFVFTLETTLGWYSANGFVSRNCRCRMLAVEAADAELPPPVKEPAATTVEAAPVTAADDAIDRLRVLDPGDHPGVDPAGWQFQTDPDLHALSLWSDPAASRAIVQAQDDLVFGRVPSAALEGLVPLIREATGVLSLGQVQDHVLAAAGRLDGLVRSVPAPSTGPVYAGAEAGPYRVGQVLGSVPRRWAATRPSGPVFELEPGAPVVQPPGAAALFVGPVMVTGVSGDRVSVRAVDQVAFAAAAGRASLYDAFYNQHHDKRGRFARKGEGRTGPAADGFKLNVAGFYEIDMGPNGYGGEGTTYSRFETEVAAWARENYDAALTVQSWAVGGECKRIRRAYKGALPLEPFGTPRFNDAYDPARPQRPRVSDWVAAIEQVPMQDVVTYRGVRGYDPDPSGWEAKIGSTVDWLAPGSASTSASVASRFTRDEAPVMFEVHGRGAYLGSRLGVEGEQEIVMPPGRYRVEGVRVAPVRHKPAVTIVTVRQELLSWQPGAVAGFDALAASAGTDSDEDRFVETPEFLVWSDGPPGAGGRVEFANPYHDRRGRFARKGEGVAGGLDGIDMLVPAGTEIRHDPAFPVKEGFRRVLTHDDRLAAAAERGIAIPPGWTNVQVSVDPHAPGLRARGVDSKGRVQPRYSEEHKRSQAAEKFQRIAQFQRYAEHLDENLRRDHATDPTAGALVLMRRLGIRPGSDADKRAAKKAYGATTLEVRHVTFDGDQVTLAFDSKKGGHTVIATRDRLVIDTLRAHTAGKKPGDRIFDTTDRRTNDYIAESMPSGAPTFTNKDLRTVVGTGRARRIVAHMRRPATVAAARKARLEVARKVAKVLGNDPGEALRSYIAPEVFDAAGWAA